METLEDATLTIATDEPAYEPWMVDDDPTNGEGFESAVAYAVAEQLGYTEDQVTWTRVPFNAAIQPGPKDVRLRHQPVHDHRGSGQQAVDFSSPYYTARQAVVTTGGSAGRRRDQPSPTSRRCGSAPRWRPRASTRSPR